MIGDSTKVRLPSNIGLVIADTPYDDHATTKAVIARLRSQSCCQLFFMYPEDVWRLETKPDQVLHWVKQPSTKNTSRAYSRFVEAIAVYNPRMNTKTHWSCRTGVFFDSLIQQPEHPHKKPDSLIEKLLANHYRDGIVFDPFAGSGTVHRVCLRMGIPSFSVEIDRRWRIPPANPVLVDSIIESNRV